ncbi:MAG: 6-bladed beta-propeller [Tannerellaceae bacterium]|nr:6-bladed beta-propeller [Tannerellaceae bacterium]
MKQPLINSSFYFCLFLSFIFFSCGGKSTRLEESLVTQNEDMIVISPVFDEHMSFDLGHLIDSLKYVKLELTDESLIGEVTKLEIFEDRIYILDYNTKALFVFSIEGKYLFKIHQLGNGPGEYSQLDFFTLDRERRRIYLTDLMTYFIKEYDLAGNYISQVKIPYWNRGILPVSDNTYFIYSNYVNNSTNLPHEFNMFYTDKAFNITKGYFPYNSKRIGNSARNFANPQQGNFYYFKDHFYVFDIYKEIVYQIGPDELIPHICFDFKGESFKPDFLEKDPVVLNEYMKEKSFYSVSYCGESENYIFYSIGRSWERWSGIYSKHTDINILCNSFMDGDEFIDFNIQAEYNSWLVSVESIESLCYKKEKFAQKKSSGKFAHVTEGFSKDIDREDNPVLVFYKLTDF